ncbi:MAG: glycine zipper domain-containing protein [Planctomycetota bacterium]|jgi:uncharacterized protein YcfJ
MNRRTSIIVIITVLSLGVVFFTGCENDAKSGAAIGAIAGAAIGQAAGGNTESTLIGAGVGAGAGYVVGNERDKKKQKNEVEEVKEQANVVTVNITNSNGSISEVKLQRKGTGYVGPKAEYYDQLPSEEQLRPVYGF